MTMEGMMQKHFQHRIPKGGCVEPRINLTWSLGCIVPNIGFVNICDICRLHHHYIIPF